MQHALLGLAENPALPPELIDRLISTADADLAEALAVRPDLNDAQMATLMRFEAAAVRLAHGGRLTADNVDPTARPGVALALLEERSGRLEWAYRLAADPRVEIRERLAACPALPYEVMQTLASDPDVRVAAELALWASEDIVTGPAAHPHAAVRRSVAANEATPPSVLASLLTGDGLPPARSCVVCDQETVPFVHDPNCDRRDCSLPPGAACDGSHESTVFEIQQTALRNPATPADAATAFADHPSMLMRVEVAARVDLPAQAYSRLAQDSVPWVRSTIAENSSIGEILMRTLAADRGHDVRRRLAHNPNVPVDVLSDIATTAKSGSALLPRIASATPREVEELATSANPSVRMLVAQRRDLPPHVRDALAEDPDAKVAKSIAPHPGLSDVQLRTMVARHGVRVLAKVAANPDASAKLLEDLTQHRPPVQKAFREVARHRNATAAALLACLADRQARPLAARRGALPPEVIVELLGDEDWQVLEAAAANPSLPYSAMSELIP